MAEGSPEKRSQGYVSDYLRQERRTLEEAEKELGLDRPRSTGAETAARSPTRPPK